MSYKYHIPNSDGSAKICETDSQVVVIVGANGSGKSKLGAWMEQQAPMVVHRIAAQRSLSFNENLALKTYAQAEDMVMYGTVDEGQKKSKGYRWDWGKSYTTKLINDFEDVLAALLALKNNENDKFVDECRNADLKHINHPNTPFTSVDKLCRVWREVYPQRNLVIEDSKFYAQFEAENGIERYGANQMSDGERAVLYFAAQILCIPAGRTMIIDEPEVHLHRSIMRRLWQSLMALRKDCLFVIITHDTGFAASVDSTEKYWIRSFNGKNWEIERIVGGDIPEQLLFEILGSRKNILFVEGISEGYDTRLYSKFYLDWHVVPCGGCNNVISYTKSFVQLPMLHQCKACGIIDRDYRSDTEICALEKSGIKILPVAEVENLFIVPEILGLMKERFGCVGDTVERAVDYIVNTKFKNMLHGQIRNKFIRELKYRLESLDVSNISTSEPEQGICKLVQSIDTEQILNEISQEYLGAFEKSDYKTVLRLFNAKELAKNIGSIFGIESGEFCEKVLNLFSDDNVAPQIRIALCGYLPMIDE